MKKINKFLAIVSVIMLGSGFFTSCAVEELADAVREASPVPTGGSQAFVFENTPANLSFLPSEEQKFVIKVGRSESVSGTAATVNLVVDDPDGLFNVPSSVTFAAGATEAEIPVTFDFQLGQKASLTVGFDDADAYIYSRPSCTISVLRDYVWVSAGVASMTSSWAGGPVDIPIQFAEGSNPLRYRLESPYYYLEPDYCPEQGYHLVFELDENYNALNFLEQQYIGETSSTGADIFIYWASRFPSNTFTNAGNTFTVVAHFLYLNEDNSISGWANLTEQFVWKEGYPGKVETVDYNTMAVEEIPGAVSEYFSTAFYGENWTQTFSKAVDIHPDEPESPYKNLYYFADLYADGYGLAFYYDGKTITIPENQPTGTTFKKPLYVSQSENIASNVITTVQGVDIYTFGLKFHHEDGTVVGEFAETFYYSEDPVSYTKENFIGDFLLTGKSQFGSSEPDAEMNISIAAGATQNTFVITGIDYAETVAATFDPATSTMSIAPQELADYGPYDMALYTTTPDGNVSTTATLDFTFNMNGNLAMTTTSAGDGYLLRSEAAGGWVDGYYDLVFTPLASQATAKKAAAVKRVDSHSLASKKPNRASVVKAQKCSKGNFAVQAKVSVKKTLKRNVGSNPIF
jgi:hypothetical protein